MQRLSLSDRGASTPNQAKSSQLNQTLQRDTLPDEEDELQMKPNGIQREIDLEEEEELQMKPMLQMKRGGAVAASDDLESAIQQSRGGGQPLADSIRKPMEQAFGGVNFRGVKVHTNAQSDQFNRSIQAKAFTTGQDIFFRQGAYQPTSQGGQELLAHELTHVVQQNGSGIQRSPQSNSRLTFPTAVSIAPNHLLQAKKVLTMGGEWDADPKEYNDVVGETPVRGVDIRIEFHPNISVDAEAIGLTQIITSLDNNSPSQAGSKEDEFRQRTELQIQDGQYQGSMIDRGGHKHNNPIYGADINPSNDLDLENTSFASQEAGFSQLGKSKFGETPTPAVLCDTPRRKAPLQPNSRQKFETTALAIKGTQKGTYYGSVQWGWKTDNQGNFSLIDFGVKEFGNPTDRFKASAQKWNQGHNEVRNRVVLDPVGTGLIREDFVSDKQNVPLPLPGAPGTETLLDLPSHVQFNRMKKEATKSVSIGSGQLSKKAYKKLEEKYNQAMRQGKLTEAKIVIDQLVVDLDRMNSQGDKYWKQNALKQEYFIPLYNAVKSLAKGLEIQISRQN
ncbi:DUF4157 domain-containing protein [Leptolyngbya sp. AN02str]|uniref:eCIS core domain-containing protein n=1 Tax=Leptolyngbya sp. AN02str TaxID=3423363 RepID=UPI003D31564D